MLARDRIFRFRQIEGDSAVFYYYGGVCSKKEVGKELAERFWGHDVDLLHRRVAGVSDGWTKKMFGFDRLGDSLFVMMEQVQFWRHSDWGPIRRKANYRAPI